MNICQRCKQLKECIEWQSNYAKNERIQVTMCYQCWANWALHLTARISAELSYHFYQMVAELRDFANPQ